MSILLIVLLIVSSVTCQQSPSVVIGNVEASSPQLVGWACRRGQNVSVDLEIYVGSQSDNVFTDGVRVSRVKAADPRSDLTTMRECACRAGAVCARGFVVPWSSVQIGAQFVNKLVKVEVWSAVQGANVAERVGQAQTLNLSSTLLGISGEAPSDTSASFFAPSTPATTASFVEANTNFVYAGAAGGGVLVLIVAIVVALRCRKQKHANDDSTVPQNAMTAVTPSHAPRGADVMPKKVPDDLAMLEAWKAEALAKRELPLAPGQKPKIVFDEDDAPMTMRYDNVAQHDEPSLY
jgi:hypothetical protein